MALLNFAKRYRDMGLHPIPIEPKGKRPAVASWKQYQTTPPTDGEMEAWFKDENLNMAVVLGRGIMAVDLDGEGANDLLRKAGIGLPVEAPLSKTGNGNHVLLRTHEPVGDHVGLISTDGGKPQIDIRGIGYIVVPPSIHPNGNKYEWIIPPNGEIPYAPQALLALMGKTNAVPLNGPGWVKLALAGVGDGQRDNMCTKLAGYFIGKNIDAETVKLILSSTFAKGCKPIYTDADVAKTVDSISRKHGVTGDESREIVPVHIRDVAVAFGEQLDKKPIKPAATSFKELDWMLCGGFHPGELIYMGARPGVGKTAMALQIAVAVANAGNSVLFVSREMTNIALLRRMISQDSKIDASALRNNAKAKDMIGRITGALGKLSDLPIWLTDEAVSIEETASIVESLQNVGLIIVDHLQLMRAQTAMKEKRIQVEAVSQGLKTLAMQYKIPILCMSTLSRPSDKQNPRPTLSSLRESGELEHDADIVLLLHREFGSTEAECIVAKNRDGHVGTVPLSFEAQYLTFSAFEKKPEQGQMEMDRKIANANQPEYGE